jgi:hypothetical protein
MTWNLLPIGHSPGLSTFEPTRPAPRTAPTSIDGSTSTESARRVPVDREREELPVDDVAPAGPLSANERRARAAALRAMALSRGRMFDGAGGRVY